MLSLWMSSCSDLANIEGIESSPKFAFPLVESKIKMQDILEDFDENSTLLVDADGLLRFFYRGDTIVRSSKEVFDAINTAIPPLIPIIDTIFGFPISTPEIDVDLIEFKGGRIEYSLFNNNSNQVTLTISIPQITIDGQMLSQTHIIPAFSTLSLNAFDLTGAALRPLNDSIYFQYEAIDSNGDRVTVSNFFLAPKNLDFTYFEGILGTQIFESEQDTLEIDFYDSWVNGDVFFESPSVTINIQNSFGFPATALVEVFDVMTIDNGLLTLESPFVETGFEFNYPSFEEVGEIKPTAFTFDQANSNIASIISAKPTAIVYDIDAIPTPNVDIAGFITDSSYFAYSIDAEFPFFGAARDFSVSDTIDIDLSSYEDAKSIELKSVILNSIPLGTTVQGYFLDDENAVLDSLFNDPQQLIEPAQVDNDGSVVETSEAITFLDFKADRLDNIRGATRLILNTSFSTSNEGKRAVKVFDVQDITIKIGVIVEL